MAPAELLPILAGLLHLTVSVYLLAFRPHTITSVALATCVAAAGGAVAFSVTDSVVTGAFGIIAIGSFLIVSARFPTPLRARSFSGAAFAAASILWAAGIVYLAMGSVSNPNMWYSLLAPADLGITIALGLFIFLRLRELPKGRDDAGHAAPYIYLFIFSLALIGGGFELGRLLGDMFGILNSPFSPGRSLTFLVLYALGWWINPVLIVTYCWSRWRWRVPAALFVVGFFSSLPLLLQPGLDPRTILILRLWGALLGPGLILYAQARWAPFAGEPVRLGPTVAVTGFVFLLTYAFIFVFALTLAPEERLGIAIAPILALVVAVGTAVLVLPRARRLDLRQILARAGNAKTLGPGRVVLGRYQIVRLLGEGGQARVHEAMDRRRGRARVVLKALADGDAISEATILQDIDHPNVIRLLDLVRIPGFTLLVLEYAEGGNLRSLLVRRGGRLPSDEAAPLIDGVLSGLEQAHTRGVFHRDIKPENVLLDANGVPKLADFGISRAPGTGGTIQAKGRGTLAYLAPEQVRGDAGDARADVYAAGVLACEVLTGSTPIEVRGDDDFLARQAILRQVPRIELPRSAQALADVLRRALAKDPAARPADAAQLRTQLNAAWSQSPSSAATRRDAPSASSSTRASRRSSRPRRPS